MGSCCTKVSDSKPSNEPVSLPPFPVVTNNPVAGKDAAGESEEDETKKIETPPAKNETDVQKSLKITEEIVKQATTTGASDDSDDSDGNSSWTQV